MVLRKQATHGMKLGTWKSKISDVVVTVVKADEDVVWWENPQVWAGVNNTSRWIFMEVMEPVEAENPSPSNSIYS